MALAQPENARLAPEHGCEWNRRRYHIRGATNPSWTKFAEADDLSVGSLDVRLVHGW